MCMVDTRPAGTGLLRGMDSDRWPDLDTLKRLLDAVSNFRGIGEGGALAFEQYALGQA